MDAVVEEEIFYPTVRKRIGTDVMNEADESITSSRFSSPYSTFEALLLAGSPYAARWMSREKDAKDRIDAAFRLLREIKDYPAESIKPGDEVDIALRALADQYSEISQPDQARETYEQLRRQIMASNPEPRTTCSTQPISRDSMLPSARSCAA